MAELCIIAMTATFSHQYGLTANLNSGSGWKASIAIPAGQPFSIDAGTKSGYTFSGRASSNGGTFAIPYGDTTIMAS